MFTVVVDCFVVVVVVVVVVCCCLVGDGFVVVVVLAFGGFGQIHVCLKGHSVTTVSQSS